MRRDFYLEKGIFCKGTFDNFRLFYKGQQLTSECSNIAYIKNTLIAVKSYNVVHVYKPSVKQIGESYALEHIALFEDYNSNCALRVNINGTTYLIDSNVQISTCKCHN